MRVVALGEVRAHVPAARLLAQVRRRASRACPRCSRLVVSHVAGPGSASVGGSAARSASASRAPAVDAARPHRPRPARHGALHVEAVDGVEDRRVTGIRRRLAQRELTARRAGR